MTEGAAALARERPRTRRRLVVGALALSVALTVAAGYGVRRALVQSAAKYVPPVFIEPGPGPRAARTDWLGARLGFSRRGDVEATTAAWSLACADKGPRALMAELRRKKREEIAAAEARGAADTVSGASILTRRSARDDNPQVRYECAAASSEKLRDRPRPASSGRLLFVFDDERAPLRHVSFQRSHENWTDAHHDFEDARGALSERFGRAVENGTAPLATLSEASPLPKYTRREAVFGFSDLVAKVSIANLGGHGFVVSELVEVPWPVRADAPARNP